MTRTRTQRALARLAVALIAAALALTIAAIWTGDWRWLATAAVTLTASAIPGAASTPADHPRRRNRA